MPALPNAPKVLRITYKFAIGTDLGAVCREFYQYTGAGASAADLVLQANTIMLSANDLLIPMMGADRTLESVTITDLSSPTAPQGTSTNGPFVGSRAGGALPASAAVLQSQEILRRYRGGHPRTYWPFGTDDDVSTAQTWTTAFVNAVHTALVGHFASWSGSLVPGLGSVANVNVSYYQNFTVHMGTTGRARNVSTPRLAPIIDLVVGSIIRVGIAQIRRRLLELA